MRRKDKWKAGMTATVAAALLVMVCFGFMYMFSMKTGNESVGSNPRERNGEHRFLHLPDGSTVVLSAGSTLEYPPSFDGMAKREVYLKGQAYFDVSRDPNRPFIVYAEKLKTTVLGTSFDVSAWPADSNITVTVTSGEVKIESDLKILGVVVAEEQLIYDKQNADVIQQQINPDAHLSWKEADILFDDVTVSKAMELLEGRFGVRIDCEDEWVASRRFTTVFLRDETLEQVLNSIVAFNGAEFAYDKENKQVMIKRKHE